MEANETDFCDRLPGQHTGRLSLELQASEAAEWQRRIAELKSEIRRLTKLNHHLREVAVMAIVERVPKDRKPTKAVSASVVGTSDTVPCAEYDKLIELLYQIGDIAHDASTGPERPDTYWDIRQMAYGFREHVSHVDDSKPTNCNPESEDTPPRGDDVPATGTVPPEIGKRYICRNGKVTEAMGAGLRMQTYPFRTIVTGVTRTWMRDGKHDESKARSDYDLIAEYHEPSPPAESPDDWVTLTDPDHVIRKCDQISDYGTQWYGPSDLTAALGKQYKNCGFKLVRCRRKDLPVVPVVPPAMPSPWRPMTDDYPRDKVLWVARDDGLVYTERNPDDWPLAKAVAWMPAVTPLHPNSAPPVVPKTRTVTLREYRRVGSLGRLWTTSDLVPESHYTGRTCEVEVPE